MATTSLALVYDETTCQLKWYDDSNQLNISDVTRKTTFTPQSNTKWKEMNGDYTLNLPIQLMITRTKEEKAEALYGTVTDPIQVKWIHAHSQLLLSCIQKAVRLRQVDTCLRACHLLLVRQNDPLLISKTLKRLCIIITEDATLHPVFPYLVFFFIGVNKGWEMSHKSIHLILQGMQSVCESHVPADWRCHFIDKDIPECKENKESNVINLSELESITLKTIWWRFCYHGMKGDLKLLEDIYVNWNRRWRQNTYMDKAMKCWSNWNNNSNPKWFKQNWRAFNSDSSLVYDIEKQLIWQPKKDEIKSAVDMHCSNIVPYLMKKCNIPINEHVKLASLIWDRRSSLRKRICTCGQHEDDETLSIKCPATIDNPDPVWWDSVLKWINHASNMAWKNSNALSLHLTNNNQDANSTKKSRQDILTNQLQLLAQERGEILDGTIEKTIEIKQKSTNKRKNKDEIVYTRPTASDVVNFFKPRKVEKKDVSSDQDRFWF